ncbi:hypothetical protein [Taklimakanibacter lacteus]|uniref:hypothetical protein n=1 Tax=Taklimakanibacter lacteus TaxID=2268456 RepID=UPI000E664889
MTTAKRQLQIGTLAALALAGLSLWVGFGQMPGTIADQTVMASADWRPDLKTLDLSAKPPASGQTFPETLARPLFSPTRKPPGPRPPEPVANQPPDVQPIAEPPPVQLTSPETLILKGIFIDDKRRLALIQTPTAPQGTWLAAGSSVEGWTIRQIDKQGIALEANGQRASLTLYVDKSAN